MGKEKIDEVSEKGGEKDGLLLHAEVGRVELFREARDHIEHKYPASYSVTKRTR